MNTCGIKFDHTPKSTNILYISSNIDVVLNKWKTDFSSLFMNRVNVTQNPHMPNILDDEIIGQSEKLNDYNLIKIS